MGKIKHHRAWAVIAATVVLFALLLLLLPHPTDLVLAMSCCLLAMVFLFGIIEIPSSRMPEVSEDSRQSPVLPSRFQRPPPTLS
jgi:hypothetical protein